MELRIRDLRKDSGMTLQEMADKLGTTAQTVQRLETANMTVSVDWLEKFARVFGLHPAELIVREDQFAIKMLGVVGPGAIVREEDIRLGQPWQLTIPAAQPIAARVEQSVGSFSEGCVLIADRRKEAIAADCNNKNCIVALANGPILLRRVIMGQYDRLTLVPLAPDGDVRYDQEIRWIAPIIMSVNYH